LGTRAYTLNYTLLEKLGIEALKDYLSLWNGDNNIWVFKNIRKFCGNIC
jgi:hypothetical protein